MRRPTSVELMLLTVVVLWALNLTMSRYVITHGFQPLAYSTVRYGAAAVIFVAIVLVAERSLRVARGEVLTVAAAAVALFLNQVGFVYGLQRTSASVLGLLLGATPIFAALIGLALGLEVLHARFWVGACLSFAGVGMVAVGTGAAIEGDVWGILFGLLAAVTWAVYSVAVTPLMRGHSASWVSAVVLPLTWLGVAIVGRPQTASQDWALGWDVWLIVVAATLGPLVVTNILFFRSLDRIGPSRATLATNLQPFVGAVFALVLLGERINALQLAGGLLIGSGILVARRRSPVSPAD